MTKGHKKEKLGMSYLNAIAACAGMTMSVPDFDYGIDGTFNDLKKCVRGEKTRYVESGFKIDFQLKSTVNIIPKQGIFKYDLEVKNYKDLIEEDVGTTRILILFVLPKDEEQWIKVSSKETIIKRAAWWCSLKGTEKTSNKNRVRIEIPDNQILTPVELKRIMKLVKGGADL